MTPNTPPNPDLDEAAPCCTDFDDFVGRCHTNPSHPQGTHAAAKALTEEPDQPTPID